MPLSISSRTPLLLVLALTLGLPLAAVAQDPTNSAPPGTDMTSDVTTSEIATDPPATDFTPEEEDAADKKPPAEAPRPGLTFALVALALAGSALALATCFFLYRFVKLSSDGLRFESHWGGLGGGLGGWQLSPALAHLLIALVFSSLATLLILRLASVVAPEPNPKDTDSSTPAESSKSTGEKGGFKDVTPEAQK